MQSFELFEIVETRDRPFTDRDGSWGTRLAPPDGAGWHVLCAEHARFTTWIRKRLIVRNAGKREAHP